MNTLGLRIALLCITEIPPQEKGHPLGYKVPRSNNKRHGSLINVTYAAIVSKVGSWLMWGPLPAFSACVLCCSSRRYGGAHVHIVVHEMVAAKEWAWPSGGLRVLDLDEWIHEVERQDG